MLKNTTGSDCRINLSLFYLFFFCPNSHSGKNSDDMIFFLLDSIWKMDDTIPSDPTLDEETREPVIYEDSDEEAWETADDRFQDYDATEEGRISVTGGSTYQPHKMHNEPGFQKLNLTVDLSGAIKEQARKDDARRLRHKEKSDRATSEQVIDPRTRMILYRMLNNGTVEEVHGCISTGKEANVYYATTPAGDARAIKIYKTSILVFKDRDRYVSGEFRFRKGYCKSNPRKMVKLWAEKEMRNLLRIHQARIPCPQPLYLRSHILMMEFLGKDGWPAPRLKDAVLTQEQLERSYYQCIKMMRRMFHRCRLIHADLSEYNILFHKNRMYFIDVSQSVEHDHPNALQFLRKDISNITDFFSRNNVVTLSNRELFDFVTSLLIQEEELDTTIQNLIKEAALRPKTNEAEVNEAVFMDSFIPRTLNEVIDASRDISKIKNEKDSDLLYQELTGMRQVSSDSVDSHDTSSGYSSSGSVDDNDEIEEIDETGKEEKPVDVYTAGRDREETNDEKRARKQQERQKKKEKRETKIPKHLKKKKMNKGKKK